MPKPLILVTNDDGILAPGLAALAEAMEPLGEVWVYAPDRQQSAVSHCITLHRPLRVTEVRERWHMISGTPADCVMLALRTLLKRVPDLVVSGINTGANLGDDVTYSGTLAGAYEAMLHRLPAVAFSNVSYNPQHFDTAAEVARRIAMHVQKHGMPADTLLNVNIPDLPLERLQGVAVTRMGRRNYPDDIIRRVDPRGQEYYWIGGSDAGHHPEAGSDFSAIDHDRVSVTPIQRDQTNFTVLEAMQATDFGI